MWGRHYWPVWYANEMQIITWRGMAVLIRLSTNQWDDIELIRINEANWALVSGWMDFKLVGVELTNSSTKFLFQIKNQIQSFTIENRFNATCHLPLGEFATTSIAWNGLLNTSTRFEFTTNTQLTIVSTKFQYQIDWKLVDFGTPIKNRFNETCHLASLQPLQSPEMDFWTQVQGLNLPLTHS